ncbi:MAG: NAD(P)H-dependent oxidoreductase [Candidatus Pelagadaptatus aseana]|uniref:FMN-dependent NADH-azoreductase n=1 Tax=Candidatus Pelagadaptatus aseana TaxID=3120508 RepID=UPI0039B2B547
MNKILQINTSLHQDSATSSQLADQLARRLMNQHSGDLIKRDLGELDIPHLSAEQHAGFSLPREQRSPAQKQAAQLSDTLIQELRDSDTIIIGLPLYNFGIPSALKAWIDHVARAGETFNYTSEGPKGTLTGKQVYVIATRGGQYAGTDSDLQTPYLQQVLGFIGLDQVKFIYAEGLAMGDLRDQSIAEAKIEISKLAA